MPPLDDELNLDEGYEGYTPDVIDSTPEERGDIIPEDDDLEEVETTEEEAEDDTEATGPDSDTGDTDAADNGDDTTAVDDSDTESETETDSEDDTGPIKENRVPVSRLNKEIEKRKAFEQEKADLEARIKALEESANTPAQQEEQPPAPQFDSNVVKQRGTELFDKVLEGDNEAAAEILGELLATQAEALKHESRQTAQTEVQQDRATIELNNYANALVEKHDVLNQESQNYDQGLVDEIVELRDAYINSGIAPIKALEKASDTLIRAYGYDSEQTQAIQEAETKAVEKAKAKQTDKLKSKIEKAAKQPQKTDGDSDNNRPTVNIMEMSEADFDKLSDEQIRKLRGDF